MFGSGGVVGGVCVNVFVNEPHAMFIVWCNVCRVVFYVLVCRPVNGFGST